MLMSTRGDAEMPMSIKAKSVVKMHSRSTVARGLTRELADKVDRNCRISFGTTPLEQLHRPFRSKPRPASRD